MRRVTLRQIADRIGCSRSAVSYALRNDASISVELRRRIAKVADELGWVPNASLTKQMSLVRGETGNRDVPNIAIVLNRSRSLMDEGHAVRMQFEGALRYAERHGLNVTVFNLADEPMSPKRFRGILDARGIQGVVFVATIQPALPVEYLEVGKDFACAVAGMRFPELPFHVAIGDFLEAGRISIHRLLESGYKRPATVLPRGVDEPMAWAFSGGLATGMMEVDPANRIPILHVGRDELYIEDSDQEVIKAMLRKQKPDSVLTLDVKGMIPVLDDLAKEGIGLPLFTLDWQAGGGSCGGINQRHRSIGEAAVDLVMGQIRRGEIGIPEVHRSVHIEGEWTEVESLVELNMAS